MKVKLQPPSGTELAPFNPILPPASITQIMLLANPTKVGDIVKDINTQTTKNFCATGRCVVAGSQAEKSCRKMRIKIIVCVCVSVLTGEGASALQAGFHTGRPPVQWGRRGRPVPPTGDVGSPIAACGPVTTQQGQTGSYSMKGCEKGREGGGTQLHSTFQLHIP